MKSLTVANSTNALSAISETKVLELCRAAAQSEANYTVLATRAGFALMEYRAYLSDSSAPSDSSDLQGQGRIGHSGRSSLIHPISPASLRGRNQHSEGTSWSAWLEQNGLARKTAERWMATAERVARHLLHIPLALPFSPFIDVAGEVTAISDVLDPDKLPTPGEPDPAPAEFRQSFFDFLADKSLAEAARAALEGESPAHRLTRAANGKTAGGSRGEDRKDFPVFAGRALSEVLHHIGAKVDKKGGHWSALSTLGKQQTTEYLRLFLRGLPDDLVDYLQEAARFERSLRAKGNRPEPLALKALIDTALGQKALQASK